MADRLEAGIEKILVGSATEDDSPIIDYTILDQHKSMVSQGLDSLYSPDFRPILHNGVTYIVVTVLINEHNEVLMMQEAKSSCAGTWYLPAGRVDTGENLIDAAKREVREETGLECEPTNLLMVESAQGHWFRFVFSGRVTGGVLKTVARADAESLQACWIDDLNQLSLRGCDILPLIEKAKTYYAAKPEEWHRPILPAVHPHSKLMLRLVVLIKKKSNNRVHMLTSEKEKVHFPTCEIHPGKSLMATFKRYIQLIFGPTPPPHKPHGILSVEHCGQPPEKNDGMCITLLVSFKTALEDVTLTSSYAWFEIKKELGDRLLKRLEKNKSIYLHVLR